MGYCHHESAMTIDDDTPRRTSTRPAGRSPAPTIRQVAQLANVSPATVSRVINGSTSVSEAHRQRVLDAVAQVDYRPNRLARNLRLRQAETIGVIVPDIENPHFSEAVRRIEDAVFRAGYRLLLCNSDETLEKQRAYAQALSDERVRGVIVAAADGSGEGLDLLFDLDIPVLAFDRVVRDQQIDAVVCDNAEMTRIATNHLVKVGHTRIAYVGGRPDVDTGVERLAGYEETMAAAGLESLAVSAGFRSEIAELETTRLLGRTDPPEAVVVANNLMTIGVLSAIRKAGLRIPGDVAIAAVDDPPWARFIDPPLTVVAQPVARMADMAAQLLLDRIDGNRTKPREVVLPLELIVRESCGARAKGLA